MAIEVIYLGTTTLTKLSILTFYRRITSPVISRPLYIVIWTSIVSGKSSPSNDAVNLLTTCSRCLWDSIYPRPCLHMFAC